MAVETNPVTTPTEQPTRSPDGTILNQAAVVPETPPTTTTSTETPPAVTPETKPDDKSTLLNKDGKTPPAPAVAPEKYEAFKLPDGIKLEGDALTEVSTLFKGLNLPQESAQSLIDYHAKALKSAIDGPFNTVAEMKKDWEGKVKSEYGKDMEPGGKTLTSISRLIDSMPAGLASGFREAMDLTLVGSHPAFVKAFAHLAERLGEGTSVKGNGPSPHGQKGPDAAPKSVAQAMYPHLKSASDPA